MSLVRSASGPPALSINTGAANSSSTPSGGGLFGSGTMFGSAATAQKPAGGLFGSAQPAQAPATTGGLFGSTQTPAASSGLFGSAQPAQAPAATGGGLFGAAQPAQAPAAGGLFGSATPAATTQAQPSGGLFGAAQSAATTAAPSGGLFGSSIAAQPAQQQNKGLFGAAQPQTQTQPSGGLFGASTTQPQQQQQQTGGLFGASTQTQQQQPAQQQQQASGGLFGNSTAPSAFGQNARLTMGQLPGQAGQTIQATNIDYENLKPSTRFDQLADPIQKEIETIDKGIQRVMQMHRECNAFMAQHGQDVVQNTSDVQLIDKKFKRVAEILNKDIQVVHVLKESTRADIADAQLSFQAIDNLKLPVHYHQTNLFGASQLPAAGHRPEPDNAAEAQSIIGYFNRIVDTVEKNCANIDAYRREIEAEMPGIETGLYERLRAMRDGSGGSGGAGADGNGNGGGADLGSTPLGTILAVIEDTGETIIRVAKNVASTRETMLEMSRRYPSVPFRMG